LHQFSGNRFDKYELKYKNVMTIYIYYAIHNKNLAYAVGGMPAMGPAGTSTHPAAV
jgi:hypothetical protein